MKQVTKFIQENLERKNKIIIIVLKEVKYKGDNYYKDMQRLASAENMLIDEYQKQDECIQQLPEGRWLKLGTWKEMVNKD